MELSKIILFQNVDRKVQFRGNSVQIERTFYVEPYSAYTNVMLALLGTADAISDTTTAREKPHADPDFPFCYADEIVSVDPLDRVAIVGAADSGFVPEEYNNIVLQAGGEMLPGDIHNAVLKLQEGMNVVERFPGAYLGNDIDLEVIDSLNQCGAFITCIYRPLMAYPPDQNYSTVGADPSLDDFDWVDPQITPDVRQVQIGAKLQPWTKSGGINWVFPAPEGASNASITETFYNFSVRRLMVNHPPWQTISYLAGKINYSPFVVVNANDEVWTIPKDCARFDGADFEQKIAPDGALYWDLTYNFTFRMTYDLMSTHGTGIGLAGAKWDYVGFNRSLTYNEVLGLGGAAYYTMAYKNADIFGAIESYRPALSYDQPPQCDPVPAGDLPNKIKDFYSLWDPNAE